MAEDQRRYPRLSCAGDAHVHLLKETLGRPARVHDLSLEGCLLEAARPVPVSPGEKLEVSFAVNNLPFRVRAEVRAVRSPILFGLLFPALSDRIRSQLQDLIRELIEDSAKRSLAAKGGLDGVRDSSL